MSKLRSAALVSLPLVALSLHWLPTAQAEDGSMDLVLPTSVARKSVRELSLHEAIQIAVKNNLGIKLQNTRVAIASANLRASRGIFEPTLSATVDHSDALSPPATTLDGMAGDVFSSVSQRWTIGIDQPTPWGTNLGISSTNSRFRSSAGSAVEPLLYGTNVSLSIEQALLRGFSLDRDIPKASILRAEFATQTALQEKRIVIAREVKRTEDAYWDLVRATRSYGVQLASLNLAREQLSLTQRQIDAGILAPADLIGSESAVAQRELALVQAEAGLSATMDVLRHTLNLPRSEWSQFLLAKDSPNVTPQTSTLEEATEIALRLRPEIRQHEITRELAALNSRVADNNRLPNLSVGARYGVVGQGNDYDASVSQLGGLGARNWGVFVRLSWAPLGRAASATADSVQGNAEIAALQREQFYVALQAELRSALRNLQTAQLSVTASIRFRELAQQSLDAERKRFLNGKSRGFEVSQREDALSQARTAELSSRIAFRKASTQLDLATGQLLERENIRLQVSP